MSASSPQSGEAGDDVGTQPEKKKYRPEICQFFMLVKRELNRVKYDKFVKTMIKLGEEKNISVETFIEMAKELFDGHAKLIRALRDFTRGRSPVPDYEPPLREPLSFLSRVKTCPDIGADKYLAFVRTMGQFRKTNMSHMTAQDLDKIIELLSNSPPLQQEFIETFLTPEYKALLSSSRDAEPRLDSIQVRSTKRKRNEVAQLEDNNGSREHSFRQTYARRIPHGVIKKPKKEGKEGEKDKVEHLPDWFPERENVLPPEVDPAVCEICTPSYRLLPENCMTLQSSYQTELGRSVLNNTLVSGQSGSEGRRGSSKSFTTSKHEKKVLECEDNMFRSDLALEWFRATADHIENLLGRVDVDARIREHLSPRHLRCIGNLYDRHRLDMLDALSERARDAGASHVLLSRLNQKIEDVYEARRSLRETYKRTIAEKGEDPDSKTII